MEDKVNNAKQDTAPRCFVCGEKKNTYKHRKTSFRYHDFVPRCPECEGTKEQPYFVKCDPANSETTFTTENSRKCAALFHASEPSPTLGEPAPKYTLDDLLKRLMATSIDAAMAQLDEHFGHDADLISEFVKMRRILNRAAPLAESTERAPSNPLCPPTESTERPKWQFFKSLADKIEDGEVSIDELCREESTEREELVRLRQWRHTVQIAFTAGVLAMQNEPLNGGRKLSAHEFITSIQVAMRQAESDYMSARAALGQRASTPSKEGKV
jgi:hypothetical protein